MSVSGPLSRKKNGADPEALEEFNVPLIEPVENPARLATMVM